MTHHHQVPPTPALLRAARGLLDWSQAQLGSQVGLAKSAVAMIEAGKSRGTAATMDRIAQVFWDAGLEFVSGGVRLRQETVRLLEGSGAIDELFADILGTTSKLAQPELLIFGLNEKRFLEFYPLKRLEAHIAKRRSIGLRQRLLLSADDDFVVDSTDTYRWMPKDYHASSPVYVYGDKVAIVLFEEPPRIVLINNRLHAEERRRLFEFAWGLSESRRAS